MSEAGLSAAEVGKEIAEHLEKNREHEPDGRGRRITIIEAILLATVALLAAWSGLRGGEVEHRVPPLSWRRAPRHRTEASEADLRAMEARNFDALTFNAWFSAYLTGDDADAGDRRAPVPARVRRSPSTPWMATDPFTNPDAPKGPTYMPEYEQPDQELAAEESGPRPTRPTPRAPRPATTADDYVRTTVLLASVLFLVGISGHFRIHSARVGLIVRQRRDPDLRRRAADHGAEADLSRLASARVGEQHHPDGEGTDTWYWMVRGFVTVAVVVAALGALAVWLWLRPLREGVGPGRRGCGSAARCSSA